MELDIGWSPYVAALAMLVVAYFYNRSRKFADPLDPFYAVLVLCIFSFVLRPISLSHGLTGYLKDNLVASDMNYATWLGVAFFFMFSLGYILASKIRLSVLGRINIRSAIVGKGKSNIANYLLFVLFMLFILIASVLIATHGGVSNILQNRATVYYGAGPIVAFLYLGLIVTLMAYALRISHKLPMLQFWFILIICGLLLVLSTGERLRLLELMLGMLIVRHYFIKPFALSKVIFAGFFMVALLTSLLFFRRHFASSGGEGDLFLVELLDSLFRNFLLYDGFVAVLEHVPYSIDYSYGHGYLLALIGFIPRVVWPDKPLWGKAVFTHDVFGVDDSIFTYGLAGELWWNFGLPGILLGAFLYGYILSRLYSYVIEHRDDPIKIILYFLAYSALVLRGFKGGFEAAFMELVIKALLFYFAVFIVARFKFFISIRPADG